MNRIGKFVGIDVRYFVKDWDATHLNALASDQRRRLESVLGADIVMAGIDECVDEIKNVCASGCTNQLQISSVPYHSFTKTASFVGVKAPVMADCSCPVTQPPQSSCASGYDTLSYDTLSYDTLGHDTRGFDTLEYNTLEQHQPLCPFGYPAPRCDVSRHASFSGIIRIKNNCVLLIPNNGDTDKLERSRGGGIIDRHVDESIAALRMRYLPFLYGLSSSKTYICLVQ